MRYRRHRKEVHVEKNPLKPCVTLEQIYAFEPEKPETFTPSPLMNAILSGMYAITPLSAKLLGQHLDVDSRKLNSAIELLTGMPFSELREKLGMHRVAKLKEVHPDWSSDQIAHAAGYADRSSVWNIEHHDKRKRRYRQQRQEYLQRLEQRILLEEKYHKAFKQEMEAKIADSGNTASDK